MNIERGEIWTVNLDPTIDLDIGNRLKKSTWKTLKKQDINEIFGLYDLNIIKLLSLHKG